MSLPALSGLSLVSPNTSPYTSPEKKPAPTKKAALSPRSLFGDKKRKKLQQR